MQVYYHPRFRKAYFRLPLKIKIKAEAKEKVFREDPHNPSLKTHKLNGKLSRFWSFSVDRKYRILFEFSKKNEVIFLDVGNHKIYN
ncbi:type II toxin-antitoxin system RelE/ParE family toxin [Candidatus Gracilibacteria bacterium]|nr:type II toxin-antitoxin system RelE/ParE family toxin [Candidatus Gracilibacteria bacterium]